MRCFAGALLILAGLLFGAAPTVVADDSAAVPDSSPSPSAENAAASAEKLFAGQVLPLLQAKCFACHGNDQENVGGNLDLRTRESLLRGGESGEAAIVAGQPDKSLLYLAVTRKVADLVMPPKENDKLSGQQVAAIRQWIAAGAPWPATDRLAKLTAEMNQAAGWNSSSGIPVKTSGGLSAEWTNRRYQPDDLWAYQPVEKRLPPPSGEASPIDAFLNARLAQSGIDPAPAADRRTLIRRATFDLLGLPPTADEIAAFTSDPAPLDRAFSKVVERLLASPHYGEQMARHWLDVVRYADSSGFANDYQRGNAWRYRDYVIRAFNGDKPYDQFIREQIAGDEIAADQAGPDNSELLVAVGFLRMGPWELTSMEVAKVARQRFLDDVTNSVGETFLAHSLQCARCHDHKFDPIPTRDYYSIQACFSTTQLAERPAPFLPQENTTDGFQGRSYLLARQERHEQELAELSRRSTAAARQWFVERGLDPAEFEQALAETTARKKLKGVGRGDYEQTRGMLLKRGVAEARIPPRFAGLSPEDMGRDRIARKGLERLAWELEQYEPFAFSVYDGRTPSLTAIIAPQRLPPMRLPQGDLEPTCILIGGDPFSPGQRVAPGVLSAIGVRPSETAPTAGQLTAAQLTANQLTPTQFTTAELGPATAPAAEGRRKALARWISDPGNPLTTRAIVNRVWLWHFGQAIAGNPNNFGATGKRPSHPELLDWLAATLVERGWSLKAMHRIIMNSAAYARSCDRPDRTAVAQHDPSGTSYATFRPRRLTAEELRDSMLLVSGELNPTLGGVPVCPEINLEAALQPRQVMGTFAAAWTPSPLPRDRHRRSIYALKLRGLRDPFCEVFNEPNPDLSCERREASTVTPQVFSLFNGQASYDRAVALASAALRDTEKVNDEAALQEVYRRAFGRAPTPEELTAGLAHWRRMTERHARLALEKPSYPREVLREAVEENSGGKFTFAERLDAYADFVPDAKLTDVDRRTRGLAEVCLVIFNANEFVYVY
jgi:mono/diheme cytochrome c family protein